MTNPSGDLQGAVRAESEARDVAIRAINAEEAARKERKAAEAALDIAVRRRRMAFARLSVASRRPMSELRAEHAEPVPPDELLRRNREAIRNRAVQVLAKQGPLVALILGPLIGIPARAVRNYLDGDERFVIDHTLVGKRDAVRVGLAA